MCRPGSAGTLGIVTEVTLKVRPLPACRRYGALMFPDFVNGVRFMRELAYRRTQPASVRLMDNQQFQFGEFQLHPGSTRVFSDLLFIDLLIWMFRERSFSDMPCPHFFHILSGNLYQLPNASVQPAYDTSQRLGRLSTIPGAVL